MKTIICSLDSAMMTDSGIDYVNAGMILGDPSSIYKMIRLFSHNQAVQVYSEKQMPPLPPHTIDRF